MLFYNRSISFRLVALQALVLPTVCKAISSQCSNLKTLLPEIISFPNTSIYNASVSSYFYVQERLDPDCIVTPTNSEEVAIIVKTLANIHAESPRLSLFAVRGGGHSQVTGASNDNKGVTIDLRSMDSLSLSSDRTIASVGGGSIWNNVYEQLDPLNLTVLGGRVAGVGVGGLLTGGGISFLGPRFGFGCDNIVNMEVVLSSGDIVQANNSSNPDLFRALKGGSNNFGIVTRFDLKTVPLGDFWGGSIIISLTNATVKAQLEAFATFMDPKNVDPFAEIEQVFLSIPAADTELITDDMYYTKPIVNPTALLPFANTEPQISNSMRISNMTDFVVELANAQPTDQRGFYANTAFPPTLAVIEKVYSLWNASIPELQDIEGVSYAMIFQRLPIILEGNSLGLYPSQTQSNLGLVLLAVSWDNVADTALVVATMNSTINNMQTVARKAGLEHNFEYLNYAGMFQDPIGTYGPSSIAFLQAVSRKYDPTGLFQTGAPGGFKLFK